MLLLWLCLDETSICGATRLQKVNLGSFALLYFGHRLMFVTPNHQVDPAGNELLHDAWLFIGTNGEAFVLVLVEHQNVEPLIIDLTGVVYRTFKLDLTAFEGNIKPFIFHVTDSKESYTSGALCKQNRFYSKLFNISDLAEVVYVVIAAELVKRA